MSDMSQVQAILGKLKHSGLSQLSTFPALFCVVQMNLKRLGKGASGHTAPGTDTWYLHTLSLIYMESNLSFGLGVIQHGFGTLDYVQVWIYCRPLLIFGKYIISAFSPHAIGTDLMLNWVSHHWFLLAILECNPKHSHWTQWDWCIPFVCLPPASVPSQNLPKNQTIITEII